MDLSLSDLTTVMNVASKVDSNPLSLAGRLVGFSSSEQRAGVPTWAWVMLGVGTGIGLTVVAFPKVKQFLTNRAPWLSQGGDPPRKSKKVFGRWS